ncbi:hypothetical protein ACN2AU_09090 [Aerococcus viridans]
MSILCLLEEINDREAVIYNVETKETLKINVTEEQKSVLIELMNEAELSSLNEDGFEEVALPIVEYDSEKEIIL